jgi:hypothetical protein
MKRLGILLVMLASTRAFADCPTQQAACLLHEEGVTLLAAKKFDEAAAKFEASITAGATARAELGYALANEGARRLGIAYEAIVEANRLSLWEVRQTPKNTEITARAERIKYVMGELRSKIVLIRVTLPVGATERIVTVQREGRDARDVGGSLAVAPDDKLVAIMQSGLRVDGTVAFAAGGEGEWLVNLPVPERVAVQPTPQPQPQPAIVVPMPPTEEPPGQFHRPGRHTVVGAAFAVAPASTDDGNTGIGVQAYAVYVAKPLLLTARLGYLRHFDDDQSDANEAITLDIGELNALVGVGYALHDPFYVAAEVGYTQLDESVSTLDFMTAAHAAASNTSRYAMYTLAIGAHWRRADLRLGFEGPIASLGQSQPGPQGDLSTRLMFSIGVDFVAW